MSCSRTPSLADVLRLDLIARVRFKFEVTLPVHWAEQALVVAQAKTMLGQDCQTDWVKVIVERRKQTDGHFTTALPADCVCVPRRRVLTKEFCRFREMNRVVCSVVQEEVHIRA